MTNVYVPRTSGKRWRDETWEDRLKEAEDAVRAFIGQDELELIDVRADATYEHLFGKVFRSKAEYLVFSEAFREAARAEVHPEHSDGWKSFGFEKLDEPPKCHKCGRDQTQQ